MHSSTSSTQANNLWPDPAISDVDKNRQIVQQSLDLVVPLLRHYVIYYLKQNYGDHWLEYALQSGPGGDVTMSKTKSKKKDPQQWDLSILFSIFIEHWQTCFESLFPTPILKTYLHLLRHLRNQWAHQFPFTFRDAYQYYQNRENSAAQTTQRLLQTIGAPVDEIDALRKQSLFRLASQEFHDSESSTNNEGF